MFVATGRPLAAFQGARAAPALETREWSGLFLAPDREALYARIDARFEAMIAGGALDEVEQLAERKLDPALPVMRAHGVPHLIAHLEGRLTLAEAAERGKLDTRHYAKRQFTWARHQLAGFEWVAPEQAVEAGKPAPRRLSCKPRLRALSPRRGRRPRSETRSTPDMTRAPLTLIKPFRALRPAPGRAAEVLAPPYDVLSSAEARDRVKGKPWSFLHVSKAEIDLDPAIDLYHPAVYAKAAENLRRMIDAGVLARDETPGYYVYRLTWRGRVETGFAAVASLARLCREPHPQARADDARQGRRPRAPDRGGRRADRPGDARLSRGARDRRASRARRRSERPRSTSSPTTACATSSGCSTTRRRSRR